MRLSVLLALTCALAAATPQQQDQLSHARNQWVNNLGSVISNGEKVANIFTGAMFNSPSASKIVDNVFKYMGGAHSLLSLILGGGDGVQEALKNIQNKLVRIDGRLSRIENGLSKLKDLVRWANDLVSFRNAEDDINAINVSYMRMLRATNKRDRDRRARSLRSDCDSYRYSSRSVRILRNGILENSSSSLSKNLVAAARRYMKDNRYNVIQFLLAVTRVAMRGAEIDVACLKLKGKDRAAREAQEDHQEDIKDMMKRIKDTDRKIRNGIRSPIVPVTVRWRDLIRKTWNENAGSDNQRLARRISLQTNGWNDDKWLVLVHDYRDRRPHWHHGYIAPNSKRVIFNERRGNTVVFVATAPKKNSMSKSSAIGLLNRLNADDRYSNADEYKGYMSSNKVRGAVVYYVVRERANLGAYGATVQRRLQPQDHEDGQDCFGRCPPFQAVIFG